jgi:hypothetical protein
VRHLKVAIRLGTACALATVLAACGGGGGGDGSQVRVVNGTPTPSSTGTNTPTLTPPLAALGTGEIKPTSTATFLSATMELTITGGSSQSNGIITGGATANRVTALDTPMFSASYTATGGYRLSDSRNTATFGPAQLTRDTTTVNGNGVVLFSSVTGVEDYLALYQSTTYTSSGKGAGYTPAMYGGVGGWQHTVAEGSARQTRLDYFAYGTATPVAAMPRSGVVKFTVRSAGNYATNTDLWFLSGGDFITVDFATGTITGSVSLSGQNFFKSEVGGIGHLPIRGMINGNGATGTISNGSAGAISSVPGFYRLLFVGPSANEMIITYVADEGSRAMAGAAVGIVDPYS